MDNPFEATQKFAYTRIAQELRDRITSGTYPPGSLLPSEAELCKEFGVALGTIRSALAPLMHEDLVNVSMGVGRVVRATEKVPRGWLDARYQQIAEELRAQIERGEFQPWDVLPGEVTLGKHYGVSRHTAQCALVELKKAGLVTRERGVGRLVRRKMSPDGPVASVDVR